ncbi:pyridoxamine 5'-phosphate oxidase family protein [Paenibacillus aurantiacus]|uniref:Pyridoxamine 5'-phosphate oxidase family protein n=1 Tax=Paenibacillus aurantiacus TaxID=1936118 RepID=A0ABV5KYG6_9BACL
MRRQEFQMQQEQEEEITSFLEEMSFGFLGLVDEDGTPIVTPLNYAYAGGKLYFHGSRIGEKMTALRGGSKTTFAVAKEYAVIPSYFSDPLMACPATSYFKSVRIDGEAFIVDDPREKAFALEALMRKLQPEGGYKPIDADDSDYASRLKGVAVVRIDPVNVIGKFKFGQNLKPQPRHAIENGLLERANEYDAETVELMRRYCPAHQQPFD